MEAKALLAQGIEAQKQGRLAEAETLYNKALKTEPALAEAWSKLGVLRIMQGKRPEAQEFFKRAIAADENFLPAYNNLGLLHTELGNPREAEKICRRGMDIDASYLPLYMSLSVALRMQAKLSQAEEVYREAVLLAPGDGGLWASLGATLAEQGRQEEAAEVLQKAVTLDPANAEAHRMLTLCRSYKTGDPHIAAMEKLLSQVPDDGRKSSLHFALAKALEDTGDIEKAFIHYRAANSLMRKFINYDPQMTRDRFAAIRDYFTKEKIAELSSAGSRDETPVFILGMPRSGTTLTEQMLANHPDVFSAGELGDMAQMVRDIKSYANLTPARIRVMAQKYLLHLREYDMFAPRIIDKMPNNFEYAGLIHAMFPKARIIHCRRTPQATCLSIYRTRFAGNLPFSCDLAEIVSCYKEYETLMTHWRRVMPGVIHEVVYEDLVQNPAGVMKKLVDYCGLPWNEACGDFKGSARPSMTASTLAIRTPLNRDSVDKWKKFTPFIGDLLKELA